MSSTQHSLTEWSLWLMHSSQFWPLLLYRVHNSILVLGLQARTSFMACLILNSFRILSSVIFWHHVIEYFDLSVYSLIFNILPTSFTKYLLIRTLCHSPYVVYIWEYLIKLPLKMSNTYETRCSNSSHSNMSITYKTKCSHSSHSNMSITYKNRCLHSSHSKYVFYI